MQTCTYLLCHKRQSLEVNFYYIDIYKKERGYLQKTFFLWLSNPEVQDAKDNVVCFFVSFFVYFFGNDGPEQYTSGIFYAFDTGDLIKRKSYNNLISSIK